MPESEPPKAQPYKAHPWPLSDSTASPELAGWCGILGILCAGVSHHVVDGAAADAAAHRQAAGAQGWAAAACGWAAAAHLGITSTELDINAVQYTFVSHSRLIAMRHNSSKSRSKKYISHNSWSAML